MNLYLIKSQSKYYSIISGTLTDIGNTLNAQLFADYGMSYIPDWQDYSSLTNPSLLCWNNSEAKAMRAIVEGVPVEQVVYSQDIDMSHSTITGIDSVDISSDTNTLFAVSFDSGTTWWNYVNNAWVQLTSTTAGQTKDDIEAIDTTAWAQKATTHLQFRWTLLDENCYVTRIQVNFTN